MNTEVERIQKAIDIAKKNRPKYGQILDLFGKIMIKQAQSLDGIKVKPAVIKKDEARTKLRKGMPLLSREDFQIDTPSASRLFKELCKSLKSENQKLKDEIGKIESALEKGDLTLEEIFQSILKGGGRISELAETLLLDRDIMLMLATASVKPSLEAIASRVRDMVEGGSWSKHYCPVCGSSPAMSELRQLSSEGVEDTTTEGAERILYCSFCGTEWRAMRLGCAFCGNTDAESLRYFYTEDEKGYRIDVCEKCKKYIKTVDSREISHEIVFPMEDISTMHLDIIAEEEGYKREAWLMPHGI